MNTITFNETLVANNSNDVINENETLVVNNSNDVVIENKTKRILTIKERMRLYLKSARIDKNVVMQLRDMCNECLNNFDKIELANLIKQQKEIESQIAVLSAKLNAA